MIHYISAGAVSCLYIYEKIYSLFILFFLIERITDVYGWARILAEIEHAFFFLEQSSHM